MIEGILTIAVVPLVNLSPVYKNIIAYFDIMLQED